MPHNRRLKNKSCNFLVPYFLVSFEIRKALPVFLLQTPLDQPRFYKEETPINSKQSPSRALRYFVIAAYTLHIDEQLSQPDNNNQTSSLWDDIVVLSNEQNRGQRVLG